MDLVLLHQSQRGWGRSRLGVGFEGRGKARLCGLVLVGER